MNNNFSVRRMMNDKLPKDIVNIVGCFLMPSEKQIRENYGEVIGSITMLNIVNIYKELNNIQASLRETLKMF